MGLSVVITTSKDEDNIERCIDSVRDIADEIIVVDGISPDHTARIGQFPGAKVITNKCTDLVSQKNFASEQAHNDWVLSIDADEVLSGELKLNIKVLKTQSEHGCYQVKRLSNYCGKWIRYCGWYPDKSIRVFDRTKGKWRRHGKHGYWKPYNVTTEAHELDGDLLHYKVNSVQQHLHKVHQCANDLAEANIALGKSATAIQMLAGPLVSFFKVYFIRLGFMDGSRGYQISRITAYAAFLKYKKMRMLLKNGRVPPRESGIAVMFFYLLQF